MQAQRGQAGEQRASRPVFDRQREHRVRERTVEHAGPSDSMSPAVTTGLAGRPEATRETHVALVTEADTVVGNLQDRDHVSDSGNIVAGGGRTLDDVIETDRSEANTS